MSTLDGVNATICDAAPSSLDADSTFTTGQSIGFAVSAVACARHA